MSMDTGSTRLKQWRPLERAGYVVGCIAGGASLVLLWIFSASSMASSSSRAAKHPWRPY